MNFVQVENLLRPATKKGLPANPEVEAILARIDMLESTEASRDILESLRKLGEIQ